MTENDETAIPVIASRIVAGTWIGTERREYADVKYDAEKIHKNDIDMNDFGLTEAGMWWTFLTNYLRRAQILGVDTPQGMQAFGKFVVTCHSAFEAMIRNNRDMLPEPGHPSGEIVVPWKA